MVEVVEEGAPSEEEVVVVKAGEAAAASSSGAGSSSADGGSSSAAAAPAPAVLSPEEEEERRAALAEAQASKARGNAHFKAQEWESAIECYTDAIERAPADATEAAAFYANRAACYAKLAEHESVVEDCTAALALQPDYTKALLRRALAREALDGQQEAGGLTSALQEAVDDVKAALAADPTNKEAQATLSRLEAANAAKLEKQKEEMMGKLKDLGNSVLGRFGMSLDNFKAEKDPNTGSYNISFGQ